jgi:hypothetical protein
VHHQRRGGDSIEAVIPVPLRRAGGLSQVPWFVAASGNRTAQSSSMRPRGVEGA